MPGVLLPSSFMPEGRQSCTVTVEMPNALGDGRDMLLSFTCLASPGMEADGSVSEAYLVWKKAGMEDERILLSGEWHLYGIFSGQVMQNFSAECNAVGSGVLTGCEMQGLNVLFSQRQNNADGEAL